VSHAEEEYAPTRAAPETAVSIAIVEDDDTLRQSCASVLSAIGYDVTVCARGTDAAALVRRRPFDIVLLDLHMGQVSGMEILASCLDAFPDTIVIIMTGDPSVESSIAALRVGAWDYLPKPFTATHLQVLVGRAAHAVGVARETRELAEVRNSKHGPPEEFPLVGESPAFLQAVAMARRVAGTDASVFLTGESGTGKEQIAQFIHRSSRRNSRQLVAVNCAALPDALLESEMFGHVSGAFTGAVQDKPGLLEAAHGGTMFLDEITEMPAPMQAKLLRVIQDGIVRRLGSTRTDAVVNVRFISASNRDIGGAAVGDGLRDDLFYRLCVVPIRLPPLRERQVDIPVLANFFLQRLWLQHRGAASAPPVLGPAAVDELRRRHWPGNVRELQNVMEHAAVLLEPGREVKPTDLPDLSAAVGPNLEMPGLELNQYEALSYRDARDLMISRFESGYLQWLVRHAGGNMSRAARLAGVDRTTLYRLMEKHSLRRSTLISRPVRPD
jgi:DNA-binding NtrC family response regulator